MEIVTRTKTVSKNTAIGQCIAAATRSQVGSLSYIRRITKATCEHILFSRVNFDRNNFKSMLIDEKQYKVLRAKVNSRLLVDFKEMLKALLQLVDRDYVSEARMFFANKEEPTNPLESYLFKFMTEENEVYTSFDVLKKVTLELKQSTSHMFGSVFNLNDNYKVLDHEAIEIHFTVSYRNGKHPRNIDDLITCKRVKQTLGETLIEKSVEKFPHCYAMGRMNTGRHKIKINAKGQVYEPNTQQMDVAEDTVLLCLQPEAELLPETEDLVACLCGVLVAYDKIDMLQCKNCTSYQHGVCLGYRNSIEFPEWYICPTCSPNIEHPSSEIACIRLSIAMCHAYQAHPEALFQVQPFSVRKSLYRWFTVHNFHTQIGNKFVINFDVINEELMSRIFDKS